MIVSEEKPSSARPTKAEKPTRTRPSNSTISGVPANSASIAVASTTVQSPEGVMATRAEGLFHMGPLPSPATLQAYHNISPKIVTEIIDAFSEQGKNRRSNESWVYKGGVIRSILGVVFAFILGMTALLGGIYLVLQGYSIAGTVFGGFGIVGLVNAFILGTRAARQGQQTEQDDEDENGE